MSSILNEIEVRSLRPNDLKEVKKLCQDWFPVEYPDAWYQEITSNSKFYSLAANLRGKIVGLLVAEVKTKASLHNEDSDILASNFSALSQVAYILSLGVAKEYRRNGIATMLFRSFLAHHTSQEKNNCKAIYLHVLSSNLAGIRFYERNNFKRHHYLPYYYSIHGQPRDGYSYVLYINGGQPPWTFVDYVKYVGSQLARMQPCNLPQAIARHTRNFFTNFNYRRNNQVSNS